MDIVNKNKDKYNMNEKLKHIPLSICGYCNKNTKDDYVNGTEKVIQLGFANMLCRACKDNMYNELTLIAMKYLNKN